MAIPRENSRLPKVLLIAMMVFGAIYVMFFTGNEFARDFRKSCRNRIPDSAPQIVVEQLLANCERDLRRALEERRNSK